jgi:MFS transporter, DHA2 family, multidrug resistance protein
MSDEVIQQRRWAILGVLVLSLLVVVLDTSILNVALKTLAAPKPRGLGASQSDLEWATNAYTLAFAGLLFTWGVLGDRVGRKRVLLGGIVAFGLSSLLSAYSQTPNELIVARALMGVSGAAVLPSTLSIISNVFAPRERAKAIGIWAGAVGLALAIGPITGGILLEHFWWGSVFLVNVPIVIVALVLMVVLVPDSRNPRPGRLDPLGVGLSIAGITSFVYGIVRGGDVGWGTPEVLLTLAAGVALLAIFIAWERRAPSPVLDVTLFRSRPFSAAVAVIALVFLAMMGLVFFLSFYLQSARDFSPLKTGLLLVPLAVGQLLFSSRSAGLVVRYGARRMTAIGLLLMTVAFAYYTTAGAHSPLWLLELMLFLQGAGIANVMPPSTSAIMASVPREKAGEGSAIGNTARQLGGALGVAILGSVLSSAYRAQITPQLDRIAALAHDPASLRAVSSSITATLSFAAHAGTGGRALVLPATDAFIHAMHAAAAGSALVGLIGMIVALRWLPGRIAAPSPTPSPAASARPVAAPEEHPVLIEA